MISEEFLVQILSLQKSEVDEYISPSCIKLESKLMEQDKSKKNDFIDEFEFGIYGCRRKSRYGSSCCGYRIRGWREHGDTIQHGYDGRWTTGIQMFEGPKLIQVFECPRDPLLFQT